MYLQTNIPTYIFTFKKEEMRVFMNEAAYK